ncbi:GPW/gp25 family protein [Mucilaginibacter robiniae]|uniref:GPW/gp25 family protein n=1 Tax=Mucilaginibacter robiniae TaxID=2728022 RepID=A0A7L5E1D8_9SPHI|nr:GPW/gp25 family protein [Mucilaginibacter robiniae]QJD96207.1 GPW/gp25 family protein [Mucilaginibacter robiniae]
MEAKDQTFLGKGWGFPPTFDKVSNTVRMVSDIQDIEESIRLILSTIPGERLMQPKFGCELHRLVFEEIDSNLITRLQHMIYQALLNFEPRVKFVSLNVLHADSTEGMLALQIIFDVIITNTRHNIVYPFYLIEGTNL